MNRENQPLVTDEPVEVQDFRKFPDHFIGIYRIFLKLMKKTRKMSTCNRLDLELGEITSENRRTTCDKK
jgi:hypothetical protein